MTESPCFTTLPNRGLVTVSGPDRRAFLQGLITNDINLLDQQACVYACLLNAQGKFLHDFFITEHGDTITLECEGGARAEDLSRRLSMYKLRADVKIECVPETPIYSIFPSSRRKPGPSSAGLTEEDPGFRRDDGGFYPDPRHLALGHRSFTKPTHLEEKPFADYDRLRISLTIPDGSRDMIPEKSTLLECGIDKLNGISFEKGCYTGQELTARMHYRGLAKKHLYTIKLPSLRKQGPLETPPEDPRFRGEGNEENMPPGIELRSTCDDIGIALLKDEEAARLNAVKPRDPA